jgi:HEAT repeat protein
VILAVVALLVLVAIALAIVPRLRRAAPVAALPPPAERWTRAVGEEFDSLSDAERCDLIFALAVLEDETSARLLVRALDDPSEAVALAAACALARRGGSAALEHHLDALGERARTLRLLVEILN